MDRPNTDILIESIRSAIEAEIKEIVEIELRETVKRVESEVRSRTGSIAAKVLGHFSMERFGTELRITVGFKNANA